jgi:hypothetical protein
MKNALFREKAALMRGVFPKRRLQGEINGRPMHH